MSETDRRAVQRDRYTWSMLIAAFVIACVLFSFFIIHERERLRMISQDRLAATADAFLADITREFTGTKSVLHSTHAFFVGSEIVTRKEFYAFVETSRFFEFHPEFSSYTFVERVLDEDKVAFEEREETDTSVVSEGYPGYAILPEGARDEYWPIRFIYPEDHLKYLLGTDQRQETVRAENVARARDTNNVSVSTIVHLKQGGEGLLLTVPLYAGDGVPDSIAERRERFAGAFTAAVVLDTFFSNLLENTEIRASGIAIHAEGRGQEMHVINTGIRPKGPVDLFYGETALQRILPLSEGTAYQFFFAVPASNLLSVSERIWPLILTLMFLLAAFAISAVIIWYQESKRLTDLAERYAFISTLSHQLRTPLTTLRWQIESLGTEAEDAQAQEFMQDNVLALNAIVDRMLLGMEIAEKDLKIKSRPIGIGRLYGKAVELVAARYPIERVTLVGRRNPKGLIVGDEGKLALALSFIIENGLVYSPKEKNVRVELSTDADRAFITVRDEGYGIPQDEQTQIFKPFFRARNATLGASFGSGTSLAIARSTVRYHGGDIRFTSEEGKGSTFTVELPLAGNA